MSPHEQLESQSFLFADLAGFTALTEAHGDEEAVALCRHFTAKVAELVAEGGAELVKTIGDEVMVRTDSAEAAVELGGRIVASLARHRSPPVRVGIHTGPAIAEDGDYFGATVNLASRVTGGAKPGEVLISETTRAALPPTVKVRPRGRRAFKNVATRVAVFAAAERPAGHELDVDPVCRMAVDHGQAARMVEHGGRTYWFCSDRCADAFEADRRRYIGRSPGARAARGVFRLHLRIFFAVMTALAAVYAIVLLAGGPGFPWPLLVLAGWVIPLALHYRAARHLL